MITIHYTDDNWAPLSSDGLFQHQTVSKQLDDGTYLVVELWRVGHSNPTIDVIEAAVATKNNRLKPPWQIIRKVLPTQIQPIRKPNN